MARLARVKPGLSHAQYRGGDVFEASDEEWQAFGDKFEEVRRPRRRPPPEPPDVTDAALQLAAELRIDLDEVEGSGQDGRITIRDVRAYATTLERESEG